MSTFDGEPTIHEHYDSDGEPTGTTVIPGWSDEDRAWALGLALREANQCGRCGGDLNETLNPDYLWRPLPPAVCLRCVGMKASATKYEKHDHRTAMMHMVERVTKPKPGKRRG